jgi:hypothetical protein
METGPYYYDLLVPFVPLTVSQSTCKMVLYLFFKELFTGLVEGACLVGHKQVLLLQRVQVLEGSIHVTQNSVALFLITIEMVSRFPAGVTHREHSSKFLRDRDLMQFRVHCTYIYFQCERSASGKT